MSQPRENREFLTDSNGGESHLSGDPTSSGRCHDSSGVAMGVESPDA